MVTAFGVDPFTVDAFDLAVFEVLVAAGVDLLDLELEVPGVLDFVPSVVDLAFVAFSGGYPGTLIPQFRSR